MAGACIEKVTFSSSPSLFNSVKDADVPLSSSSSFSFPFLTISSITLKIPDARILFKTKHMFRITTEGMLNTVGRCQCYLLCTTDNGITLHVSHRHLVLAVSFFRALSVVESLPDLCLCIG